MRESPVREMVKEALDFSFSTNLFFQTLGKFNQQTFSKSLTKNAAQASREEKLYQQLFCFAKTLTKKCYFYFFS